jgi:hypothetical protein
MKTGRLIKFRRPEGDVHAYLYREGGNARAAIYVAARAGGAPPAITFSGPNEAEVEAQVRAWVEEHFPRQA